MKTLLLALISPLKSKGTREGAIRGFIGIGKEAVRTGLVSGGAKVVGSEVQHHDSMADIDWVADEALTKAVMDALRVLRPPSDSEVTDSLNVANEADNQISSRLQDVLGDFFAEKVMVDAVWARAIVGEDSNQSPV
ncbi:hypothetical protein BT96DRAFT_937324 [Gymnopus androsaceus JB14]|uniref:Uncharacterized protein n=1 Tax=Gymnopus androsaceus JB14 TaxID=1447944 RepID=A0A6A4HZM4_9AGAR|nr:hypothetical protein BT96DRAFT_937324 [Gymnopus androsaceus JB14]